MYLKSWATWLQSKAGIRQLQSVESHHKYKVNTRIKMPTFCQKQMKRLVRS